MILITFTGGAGRQELTFTVVGKTEKSEGGFGNKEFNYGQFNFTALDIQLQRLKWQLHFFFRDESCARNSNLGVVSI